MRGIYFLTLIFVILSASVFGQTTPENELISLRNRYSKTFELPNGEQQAMIYGKPIHYRHGDSWEDIDATLIQNGDVLSNTANSIQSIFPLIPEQNIPISFTVNGHLIELERKKEWVRFSNGVEVVESFEEWNAPINTSTDLSYTHLSGTVTDRYEIQNGAVKNDILLHTAPNAETGEGVYYGFRESLHIPSGWRLEAAVEASTPNINHGILVLDENDTPQMIIPSPIVHDANGIDGDGSSSDEAAYVIEQKQGVWYISTLIPSEWLNSEERVFPITFDPTLTIPGNTGGWQSQNNFVDNPGFVFIGVCCGNLEHRAWIKWNVSAIPTNACVSLVELELFVNGVGSSVAELVHAFDMMTTTSTNMWGPYGAINTAAYNDQATGLYTSFTMTGTGTYGWYDLGPNAYADLMTMVNSFGWYQVALIFDNEPSTNWKRLSATQCNLRVTYENPPCTVLPIELSSFDVSCKDGQAALNWTTLSEYQNDYFTVSKSTDGSLFTTIAEIPGTGNSIQEKHYSVSDEVRQKGPIYYRLSQTDFDGTETVHATQVFHGCDLQSPLVSTESSNSVRIRGQRIETIAVFDPMGNVLSTFDNQEGLQSIRMDLNVSQGLYLVKVVHDGGRIATHHVYLQR
jgi:hypothetical protein